MLPSTITLIRTKMKGPSLYMSWDRFARLVAWWLLHCLSTCADRRWSLQSNLEAKLLCMSAELKNHSFYVKKAHRPLFQQTLQKSKQSCPGIAAVLLHPHFSHKGPPLLLPAFPSFNPNLNEARTKRSCQWSARRGGLTREMKTCRRLQPNRLPVSKQQWQGATFLSWRPFNEL